MKDSQQTADDNGGTAMSQDPFLEREAEKYEEELANELNLSGEEQLEALRRRLRAMERDGQLVFTRRQCYALPERLDLLKGTVIGHRDGYGFLRLEGVKKDDVYLSAEQMKMCIHGDVVLAQPVGTDRKGRREARIRSWAATSPTLAQALWCRTTAV
jgi:ribonuclease R